MLKDLDALLCKPVVRSEHRLIRYVLKLSDEPYGHMFRHLTFDRGVKDDECAHPSSPGEGRPEKRHLLRKGRIIRWVELFDERSDDRP